MRVGIIGNYGHNNNGDEAILLGILAQLQVIGIPKENVVVFSNYPNKTAKQYNIRAVPLVIKKGSALPSARATLKQAKKVMKELDLVIIGGGGLLMDMYRRDAPLYSSLGTMAKRCGCRLIIHSVGAGPIRTRVGTFFLRRLVKAADAVSVRDNVSKQLIEKVSGRRDIEVVSDPAFAIPMPPKRQQTEQLIKVGITAAPYYSKQYWPVHDEQKYQQYIRGMANAADQLIEQHRAEVTFFSTKYPQDTEVSKDIQALMAHSEKAKIIDRQLLPDDIMRVSSEQDIVIGTRLHSLILSVTVGTPVIGIEYHHKVKHFMEAINEEAFSLQIGKHGDGIVQAVNTFQKQWPDTQARIARKSAELHHEAFRSLENIEVLQPSGPVQKNRQESDGGQPS
ncbi:polysaccharide pyruvyl transferase family protein [Geomicrobium sp. JCM 19039]|uniref:polysaccharide pyruvyl transferase family protein n=1 Tax=Geomicrobium sp. JCM 19039 TaxID=1460636 RepID=UPI00045F39FF|nr:polysaccharide pyruvyl transferase family protein [Geomicrobium sp. JCM 19039]GAK11609.1 polysaccharide pyruvyl transferase [Geomicrobium sp. JCM 19039]